MSTQARNKSSVALATLVAVAALSCTDGQDSPRPGDAAMDMERRDAPAPDGAGDADVDDDIDAALELGRTSCSIDGTSDAAPTETTILFGDLHTHSSVSLDSTLTNIPILRGRPYGPEDSCIFARYCSQLDFWSINDHAEEMLATHWERNVEAIRSCNDEFGGYSAAPELVSYLGWEWTHSTNDPASDFGHHNVVLRDTCDGTIMPRPIASPRQFAGIDPDQIEILGNLVSGLDPDNAALYESAVARVRAVVDKPRCPESVASRRLPTDCHETAASPARLYDLFETWGIDALAVPHGSAWGTHHAQGTSWRNRFGPPNLSQRWSPLLEIHSGHGNSEEYRAWRHILPDAERASAEACPEPTAEFEPCCWRAGEIVRSRTPSCETEPDGEACTTAVRQARADFLEAGKRGYNTLSDTTADDWLDCGQCRDCFQPALGLLPERTAQAALAMTRFDEPSAPWRYRPGFISSTDTHRSGPGAGYKEMTELTDAAGPAAEAFEFVLEIAISQITPDHTRKDSFLYGGGLVAVHSYGTDRHAIWDALLARRVYATTGARIELTFDLVTEDGTRHPMGSELVVDTAPTFEVRALGGFVQAPGCPVWVHESIGDDMVERLCFGECFHPTAARTAIDRVEVVRVRPQESSEEPLDTLIQDPWQVLPCEGPAEAGCTVTFRDEELIDSGRPATYYVRAVQAPTPMFNADGLRCERDELGQCIDTHPCEPGFRGDDDDCLALGEERAWASPIFVTPP